MIYLAEYLVCVTTNGLIRWKLYIERDPDMNNIAISNIVSNMGGILFFTISWFKQGTYLNKICRILNAETNNPIEECGFNDIFYQSFQGPLSIDDLSVSLMTTLYGQGMALINTTNLQIEWTDRVNLGATNSHYNSDGTGIYWIGNDDHLRKVNGRDSSLLDVNINSGGNQYYAFNAIYDTIVRVSQNFSLSFSPIVVSGWDVDIRVDFHLLWQWNEPDGSNASTTHPVIDEKKGMTYVGVLPYLYAIDTNGKTQWKAQIAYADEMGKYNLHTFCLALNTETNIAYVVVYSFPRNMVRSNVQTILFIVPVRTTTGDVLPRIRIEVPLDVTIFVKCPILVGNQMLYLPWFAESTTDVIPLNVIGIPQLNS